MLHKTAFVLLLLSFAKTLLADTNEQLESDKPSPWLTVPMVSSDPKVGTSLGGMVSYLFKIDSDSTSSLVGAGATYSSTDSRLGGVFLRTYWDTDKKRFSIFAGGGEINNDYEDFLGSGLPAQTQDTMKVIQARYLQQFKSQWFAGIKATYTNYLIASDDTFVNGTLNSLGLTCFDSTAIGLIVMRDSRNNQNDPTEGSLFQVENFAYRKALGGEEDFDTYNLKFNQYWSQSKGKVLAYSVINRWTVDASPGAYSSISLRGYTRGQYLAPHSTSVEIEERLPVAGRFGVHIFAGMACLYGNDMHCDDSRNLYTSIGLGGRFTLNEAEHMVMSFDFAWGEAGNHGFYMRFGNAF